MVAAQAPRTSWPTFTGSVLKWIPGEHFGLIGPTGMGKTTMLMALLPLHKYVTVFATKPRDSSMDALIRRGYKKYERWPLMADPKESPRRVIWPDATHMETMREIQKDVFSEAMARIYRIGNWTVAIDELWWFTNELGMGDYVKTYYLQARSLNISLIAGVQRPAWVPREMYTSCTHLMFWRTNDETDLKSLSGIGFKSSFLIREVVSNLDPYEALYINTRSGKMARVKVPKGLANDSN
jgi:energy-coupling factor transporter ATP-binding protein EcfA2